MMSQDFKIAHMNCIIHAYLLKYSRLYIIISEFSIVMRKCYDESSRFMESRDEIKFFLMEEKDITMVQFTPEWT